MFVKILLLALFALITIAVGLYFQKKATTVGDFILGGREIGPWLTAFAYGTSYFSSVVFVGYAGQFGWNFGIAATWIGVANAVIGSLLAWTILGRRTRMMTKHFESATMPDFFEKRYESRALKIVSSLIIFVFLVPYSASVYKGLSGLFSIAFGIDFVYCVIGIAILTGIYVVAGGYVATAINDFIQGIIMIVGILFVVFSVLNGRGGFSEAIKALSVFPSPSGQTGAYTSLFGPAPFELLGVAVLTSLGAWGLPQMVHKFYTIKSEQSIRTGTVISTAFALIIAGGSYFMGAFGKLYYTPAGGKIVFDEIVPTMLSNFSDLLIGVVIVLVLSASMSTLSSLVIASSATFALDFLKGTVYKEIQPKHQVLLIRLLCTGFILISMLIALNPSNLITTLMSLSWGALAGSFLGPFLYGLFWKGGTKAGVWACFASGSLITAGNFVFKLVTPTLAGAIAILCSLIFFPLFSALSPKPSKSLTDSAFALFHSK